MGWLPRVYLLGSIADSLEGFIIHQSGTSPGHPSAKTKSGRCMACSAAGAMWCLRSWGMKIMQANSSKQGRGNSRL